MGNDEGSQKADFYKIEDDLPQYDEKWIPLVVFGEALLPGYPFWIEHTDGARSNSPVQKEIHAHYLQNAVQLVKVSIFYLET